MCSSKVAYDEFWLSSSIVVDRYCPTGTGVCVGNYGLKVQRHLANLLEADMFVTSHLTWNPQSSAR